MEQQNKNSSKKAAVIAIAVILVAALLVAGYFLLSADSRVVGIWTGGPVYLDYYKSNCNYVVTFGEDGEYAKVLTNSSGDILDMGVGTWNFVERDLIKAVTVGGDVTHYDYSAVANELTSGDWIFEKTK